MTASELAAIAIAEFNPCIINDATYDAQRESLIKSALVTFDQYSFPYLTVQQTDALLLEIAYPAGFKKVIKVSDACGLYIQHTLNTVDSKIVFTKDDDEDLSYPISISYLVRIDTSNINADLPETVAYGSLLDLIKAKFGKLNQRVLKTLGTFGVGEDFQGDPTDWDAFEQGVVTKLKEESPPLLPQTS